MIETFTWTCINSNSFYLSETALNDRGEKIQRGLLIDPVDNEALYARAAAADDILIFLTHCHYDHICGLNRVRELTKTKVVCSEICSKNITLPKKNLSTIANAMIQFYDDPPERFVMVEPFSCAPADEFCRDGQTLTWCGHTLDIIELNGHTNGCIAVLLDRRYLFSGDSLLPYPTVTRLPGGSAERFWQEDIPKLESLIVETVYPGHGAPGDIKDMLDLNKNRKRSAQTMN